MTKLLLLGTLVDRKKRSKCWRGESEVTIDEDIAAFTEEKLAS